MSHVSEAILTMKHFEDAIHKIKTSREGKSLEKLAVPYYKVSAETMLNITDPSKVFYSRNLRGEKRPEDSWDLRMCSTQLTRNTCSGTALKLLRKTTSFSRPQAAASLT